MITQVKAGDHNGHNTNGEISGIPGFKGHEEGAIAHRPAYTVHPFIRQPLPYEAKC